jgi:hypothetical protein
MEDVFHDLEPNGDVLLVLRNPNSSFAKCDQGFSCLHLLPSSLPASGLEPSMDVDPVDDLVSGPVVEPVASMRDHNHQDLMSEESNQSITISRASSTSQLIYLHEVTPPFTNSLSTEAINSREVRIQVSSGHLILASPYLKRILEDDWEEAQSLGSKGCVSIDLKGWDPDALLILINIIHGFTQKVPGPLALRYL